MIETFRHPRSCPFSPEISLSVGGQPVEVIRTEAADFANFLYDSSKGPVEVEITRHHDTIDRFAIRPLSKGINGTAAVKTLRFTLTRPEKLSIDIEGLRPLFLWANPPESDKPSPDDPNVRFFKAGQTYEIDCLSLRSGETLYIKGGAVLKTRMVTSQAADVTIRGHGIFDGSYYQRERGDMVPGIVFAPVNQGYTISVIGGWGPENTIEDIQIENLRINDKTIRHIDGLEITTRYATNIRVVS